MEWNLTWFSTLCALGFVVFLIIIKNKMSQPRLPPGPRPWPLIGNIRDLGKLPHQNLYSLDKEYGPVIWLRLGSVNTMVVQSSEAASQFFKNHDLDFADRKVAHALTVWNFHEASLSFTPHGPYWRLLRRLYSTELLSNKRLQDSAHMRQEYADKMIQRILEDSAASRAEGGFGEVQIWHHLLVMSLNFTGKQVFSKDLGLDSKSGKGLDFLKAMETFMKMAAKPNPSDLFPLLKWLDLLSIKRDMTRDMGRVINIIQGWVNERIQERESTQGKAGEPDDFLAVLMDYRGDRRDGAHKISEGDAIINILEIFFGGAENTSTTVEWAMTELIRKPDLMRRAQEELDRVVGQLKRKVQETDFNSLPYLQAVVKETLRLYPPIPLLLPRNAVCDTEYMGFFIPKGTQVFINAWAIGRDAESWEDPLSFNPDRFLGSSIDFIGQDFQLLPFGSGRRNCVGHALANRTIMVGLCSLLLSFNWEELDHGGSNLDVKENMGLTLRKLKPLKLVPKMRSPPSILE